MDKKQFFEKVVQMRKAQKKYFSTPASQYFAKQQALEESKKLEREIDKEIERVQKVLAEQMSPKLQFE